jgi:uncharacterized protein GlcG (DUF336 family)
LFRFRVATGCIPIVDENGVFICTIGVCGCSVENDHQVAEAGVKVVGVSDLPNLKRG